MKTFIKLTLVTFVTILFFSCKTDQPPVVSFSYELDEDTVTFTNTTVGATSYLWDFGDNSSTSTETNPVHIFPSSGSYTVTLTAMNGDAKDTYSEVITIAKPIIKIDGSFTDWSEVSSDKLFTATLPDTATITNIKTLKVTSDDNYLYFYIKMDSMNVGAFDILINADNSTTTGYNSWLWAGGCGADYMLDGLLSADLSDVAVYYFPATATDQTAWNWTNTVPAGSGVVTMSKPKVIGGTTVEFEGKIVRELVSSSWASTIGIGVFAQTPAWAIAGCLPGGGGSNVSLLQVKL